MNDASADRTPASPLSGNGHAASGAVLRQHAEQQFAEELHELTRADERQRPPNWRL